MNLVTEEIALVPFRISVTEHCQSTKNLIFPRGFSSNLIFNVWAVFGGFMIHILLCNLLTTILRPNFEEPLDTAKQLVENDITIYMGPFASGWRELMQESNITEYMILGENLVYAEDNDQFYEI